MYKLQVIVKESGIDGKGVFSAEEIAKGAIVWIFAEGHDMSMSVDQYESLSQIKKQSLEKTGYLSPWTNLWIFPPDDDPAQFTNHSDNNNLSVVFDPNVSSEPYFVANRGIRSGEELTNNYHEFDKITQQTKPDWAA